MPPHPARGSPGWPVPEPGSSGFHFPWRLPGQSGDASLRLGCDPAASDTKPRGCGWLLAVWDCLCPGERRTHRGSDYAWYSWRGTDGAYTLSASIQVDVHLSRWIALFAVPAAMWGVAVGHSGLSQPGLSTPAATRAAQRPQSPPPHWCGLRSPQLVEHSALPYPEHHTAGRPRPSPDTGPSGSSCPPLARL